jgi:transposase
MTQADRDRLVTLRKTKKRLITQRQAAEELKISVRQVKRLLRAFKKLGDRVVVHGLRGKPSNRRIEEKIEKQAVKVLSAPVYEGFWPTLASEYLGKKHGIEASKETVRQWMIRGQLWRAKRERVKQVHCWRPRRSRFGELVASRPVEDESGVVPGTTATRRPPGGGPMGHQRTRLAGGAGRKAIPDRHDRRCNQPIMRAVRAARFDRGESEAAVELPGEVRSAGDVLYR